MTEELSLVKDLAVILIAAGAFTIISKALKQPLVLGYILAGVLVGPYIDWFPGISGQEAVNQWSDIGIIFLMFTLGLEFSFKKLLKVGSSALITAGCKFLGVFVIGFLVGLALNWTVMESVFLAGLLSMSSTAVVIKAYDDMGLKDRPFVPQVFGTLVVEDIIAILLMVLLSTMAVSQKFAGGEMLLGLGKLAFFLILWFLVGIYVIPTILKKAHRFLSDEILLIVSIGLCFGMVSLAETAGFSSALGAFLMGSILAETIESERISHLVGGIKDLFSAIFFVSVGMMVDPSVIGKYWAVILLLVVIVIVTDGTFSAIGSIISGRGLSNSIHTGLSLAQLGEFGIIIAGVGVSLGVMRDFIYPVIIAVSVITTFTSPYLIRMGDGAVAWAERRIPPRWAEWIDRGQDNSPKSAAESSDWHTYLKNYFLRILLYGVILVAILIGSESYLYPLLGKVCTSWSPVAINWVGVGLTLLCMSPFIYGLAVGSSGKGISHRLIKSNKANRLPMIALVLVKIFIAISFVLFAFASHLHLGGWTVLAIVLATFIFFVFARHSVHKFSHIEKTFIDNLNAREDEDRKQRPVSTSFSEKLAAYDVRAEAAIISADSAFVGKRLKEIPFRAETGVNIVKIQRGSRSITIPGGDEMLMPSDKVLAAGTPEQLSAFRQMISTELPAPESPEEPFDLRPFALDEESLLTGRLLKDTDMRRRHISVVSVLRGEDFIANPRPDFRFEAGDVVWIAGDSSSLDWIK